MDYSCNTSLKFKHCLQQPDWQLCFFPAKSLKSFPRSVALKRTGSPRTFQTCQQTYANDYLFSILKGSFETSCKYIVINVFLQWKSRYVSKHSKIQILWNLEELLLRTVFAFPAIKNDHVRLTYCCKTFFKK